MSQESDTQSSGDPRLEAIAPEQRERLVDFMVTQGTAVNLQGLLFETPFASVPTDALAVYADEGVRALCGPRLQNRRSLRVLAELLLTTQLAASRMFSDSGAPANVQDVATKTNLAILLTAETRRLTAMLESMRERLEDRASKRSTASKQRQAASTAKKARGNETNCKVSTRNQNEVRRK